MSQALAQVPAYLTDERLKIRIKKLPDAVREMLSKRGEVALVMLGSLLSWERYELDDPFVRISLNYTFRRMIERIEGEGNKKIMVGVSWNKHYWAIHYRTDMEIDGNILYFIEGSRELLPGYVKTSKGLILPREIYYALSSINGLQEEIGVVKKEKSKIKHLLGLKHINIPIQLDLWGNEVIFRGKGQTTIYGYPRPG